MNKPAQWTGRRVKVGLMTYRLFDDGSRRRHPAKLRGKAAVKAAKRLRQAAARRRQVVA